MGQQLIYLTKVFIICFLLTIGLGFNIQTTNIAKSSGSLQIANYTGESITSSMVSFYIKTINDAYFYHGTNYSSSTDFIQNRLESTYSAFFDVIIIVGNTTLTNWIIYSTYGTSTVCWFEVNTAAPKWIYIINMIQQKNQPVYIGNFTYGTGMTKTQRSAIAAMLKKAEGEGTCTCINMSLISDYLQDYDGNQWSVICKKYVNSTIYSRIRVSEKRYYFTHPNTCQYLLWTV